MIRPTTLAASCLLLTLAACQTSSFDAKKVFLAADANGDGFIDVEELDDFIAHRFMGYYDKDGKGVSFVEMQAVNPEADPDLFKKRDSNGDGVIDFKEMRHAVQVNPTFGRLMESIDTDGDGKASQAELRAFGKRIDEI